MGKKKEENPFFTKKLGWMWLLCAPVALIGSAWCEGGIQTRKRQQKKYEKNKRFAAEYGYGWWW